MRGTRDEAAMYGVHVVDTCITFSNNMPKKNTGSRVREPVQVYLDRQDRDLLEKVAKTTGLSRAEVLRRGLRSIAEQALAERPPGYSLEGLVGSLGDNATLPSDLAERHDEYLYGAAGRD